MDRCYGCDNSGVDRKEASPYKESVSAALVSESRMHCASGNPTLYGLNNF